MPYFKKSHSNPERHAFQRLWRRMQLLHALRHAIAKETEKILPYECALKVHSKIS